MNSLESPVFDLVRYASGNRPYSSEESKKTVFFFYGETYVVMILAFVGGYIDAAGYYKLGGLFTSSITGNLVAACASIYITEGVIARAVVTIAFLIAGFVGFLIGTILKSVKEWNVKPVSILLYSLEVILMIITFAVGLNYDKEMDDHGDSLTDWRVVITAMIMGASMGMHNAAAKESIPNVPATTVMTMTIVAESASLAQVFATFLARRALVQLHYHKASEEEKQKLSGKLTDAIAKWAVVTRPLILFVIGALVGVAITANITYYSLFIPIFLLITIIIDIYFSYLVDRRSRDLLPSTDREVDGKGEVKKGGGESGKVAEIRPASALVRESSKNIYMEEVIIDESSDIAPDIVESDKPRQTDEENDDEITDTNESKV